MKKYIFVFFLLFMLQQSCLAEDISFIVTSNNPVFSLNLAPAGFESGGDVLSTRNLSDNELTALIYASTTWTEILDVTPNNAANIIIFANDELNAFASSEQKDVGQEYRKTMLNLTINNEINQQTDPGALIFVGKGLVDGHEGWETFVEPYPIFNSDLPDLYSTMVHEIYHALGMISGAAGSNFFTIGDEKLTLWDSYLRTGDIVGGNLREIKANTFYEQQIIANKETSDDIYGGGPIVLQNEYFDIYNYAPYFVGPETMKVLAGIDGTVQECQNEIINAGGLLNYSGSYTNPKTVYGLPINGAENNAPELSHTELRNSFMSHQPYQNWGILMEAELAVLKDIGFTNVQIRDYFGKSYYLNSNGLPILWKGYNDSGIGYGKWNNSISAYDNSPSLITNGIGLHIYGDNNNIIQQANILSNGLATIGARIDGVQNKYTLADGFKIETTGRNNIGLATMWGKNHIINLEEGSLIDASGKNGIGLSFDFGKNVMGGYNDHRGSYIAWSSKLFGYMDPVTGNYVATGVIGDNMDLPEEIEGELVTALNIDGTVKGDKAAIYISDNAYVKDINISETAKITGDIISNWNGKYSGVNNARVRQSGLVTNINFNNNSSDIYDGFRGKIIGAPIVLGNNVINSALKVNVLEGAVALKETALVPTLHVHQGSINPAKLISSGLISSKDILNEGTIEAKDGSNIITTNFTNKGEYISDNDAILLSSSTINESEMNIGGKFLFGNNIEGNGDLNILSSASLQLINDFSNQHNNVSIDNNLSFDGGSILLQNSAINEVSLLNTQINDDIKLTMDVDFGNQKADILKFSSPSDLTINNDANINVTSVNVINTNSALTNSEYKIELLKDEYNNMGLVNNINIDIDKKDIISPIFKYKLSSSGDNSGVLSFTRGAIGNVNSYNPAVLSTPVAAQVGGYLSQLHSYDMAFGNMDLNMLMPYEERQAMKLRNKYAMSEVQVGNNIMTFDPNQLPEESRGLWFKPFATFEKVNLSNGPNVENQAYGSYFGGDSEIISLKKGWDALLSGYVGYTGSHQNYNGNNIYQNGGTLGATGVLYKGNFFTGLTANVGASVADSSTMYGSEDVAMLMSGIASKTGYNWELANSKFIIQPSWLMSYSFINTFNHHNPVGVNINADPLHAIQLVPGLKFIGNLKNGWQPYATVQMVWNLLDNTKFQANNVALPQMSVDPYVQYGVGVKKAKGDRFTGFCQALMRNGGRNGIALSLGFRWAIGKDYSKKMIQR